MAPRNPMTKVFGCRAAGATLEAGSTRGPVSGGVGAHVAITMTRQTASGTSRMAAGRRNMGHPPENALVTSSDFHHTYHPPRYLSNGRPAGLRRNESALSSPDAEPKGRQWTVGLL